MEISYLIKDNTVFEGERTIKVLDQVDVVVAGGGPAGIAAAVSAARQGANVILLEGHSFLGGVATSVMMLALVGSSWSHGFAREIMDRMAEKGGAIKWEPEKRTNETTPFDAECFKEIALEMCLESGVKVYLYTQACDPIVIDGKVCGVITESKNGRLAVLGNTVIDCTGDADLAFRAGAPCMKGRESDQVMRPFSLLFRVGGLDIERIVDYVKNNPLELQPQHTHDTRHKIGNETIITRISGFYDLVEKAKRIGELYDWIHYFRFESLFVERGIALCNTIRIYYVDGTDASDLTKGEIIGRQQMTKLMEFMHKYIPGCENAYIIDVAPHIGVRETRRIIGEHYLTDDDAYSDRHFDDSIMTCDGSLVNRDLLKTLDVHMPDPIEGSDQDLLEKYPERVPRERHSYQIPYRVLQPKDIDNLLVAGKTISVSHMIDGRTRNMIVCMCMGQVAGVAAALSAQSAKSPKALPFNKIKEALLEQGYYKF